MVTTDISWHTLERHHGNSTGILGDLRLIGVDHIHDHAALEHLGEPPFHPQGAGLSGGDG